MADMKRRGFFGAIAAAMAGPSIAKHAQSHGGLGPLPESLSPPKLPPIFIPVSQAGGSYYGGAEFTVDCNSVIQFDPAKHIRVGLAVFHKDGNNNA